MNQSDLIKEFYQKANKAIIKSDIRPVKCCANCGFFENGCNCHGQDEVIFPVKPFFTCKRWKEEKNEK